MVIGQISSRKGYGLISPANNLYALPKSSHPKEASVFYGTGRGAFVEQFF